MYPFAASKVPKYAGIVFAGFVGMKFASALSLGNIGDMDAHAHLLSHKKQILSGDVSYDPEK